MSPIIFFDKNEQQMLPFTYTRSAADLLCGLMSMRRRWELLFKAGKSDTLTNSSLQVLYPHRVEAEKYTFVDGSFFANANLVDQISQLNAGEKLLSKEGQVIAATLEQYPQKITQLDALIKSAKTKGEAEARKLNRIWDIFSLNDWAIRSDFEWIKKGKVQQAIPDFVTARNEADIFIEEGAELNPGVILNASSGPIFIGKNACILDGALIRGPFGLLSGGVVKMGAKIYGATTIGAGSKVGGEISNVVMFNNANKGHDGYLGNSVIGEWCNLGADTNGSNLKNNYDKIKIWDESTNKSVATGLQFCGLFMGDHSKCGINTMFNTGTVVGVSANIFGGDFPQKFVPSFSWGGSAGMSTYQFQRAIETVIRVFARRHKSISAAEEIVLNNVFKQTEKQRKLFCKD